MNERANMRRALRNTACGVLLTLIAPGALAAGDALHATLAAYLRAQTAQVDGQVSVDVTMPRVRLAPCRSPQPFLPGRSKRLAGHITVGVKCPGDRPPTRYFRAYISVETPYFVAAHPLKTGELITPSDLKRVTGDITRLSPGVVTKPAALLGMVTARRVAAGMPLTENMVTREMVIKRGDRVSVIAKGAGFSITTSGKALNSAPIGGEVRVRTQGGTTVTGISRDGNTVVIRP